jgi:hypothetical protein
MRQSGWLPTLVPDSPRQFVGQRWLNIALRSLHLIGVTGVAGGFLFGLPEVDWWPFWWLCLSTGTALVALYVWSTALWLVQAKGLTILLKLLLLWLGVYWPAGRAELFMLAIVLSGVIAHAPGAVRGYTPFFDNRGRKGC